MEKPKLEIKTNKENIQIPKRSIKSLIGEAGNNFVALSFHQGEDIKTIKEFVASIAEIYLRPIEDFTGIEAVKLNKVNPQLCQKYNNLMIKLKSLEFTYDEFIKIIEDGKEITDLSKYNSKEKYNL